MAIERLKGTTISSGSRWREEMAPPLRGGGLGWLTKYAIDRRNRQRMRNILQAESKQIQDNLIGPLK